MVSAVMREADGRESGGVDINVDISLGIDDPLSNELRRRLTKGSNALIGEYRRIHMLQNARLTRSKLYFRGLDIGIALARAVEAFSGSISSSVHEYHELERDPIHIQETQRPKYAVAVCADTRVSADVLIPTHTRNFPWKTIAGNFLDPSNPDAMCDEAQTQFTYALDHLGVKEIVIVTHGPCGAMGNVVNPVHITMPYPQSGADQHYKRHADGMRFIVDQVKQKRTEYYLNLLPALARLEADNPRALQQAAEVAYALHSRKVMREFLIDLKKRTPSLSQQSVPITSIYFGFYPETGWNLCWYDVAAGKFQSLVYAPSLKPLPGAINDNCCAPRIVPISRLKRALSCVGL